MNTQHEHSYDYPSPKPENPASPAYLAQPSSAPAEEAAIPYLETSSADSNFAQESSYDVEGLENDLLSEDSLLDVLQPETPIDEEPSTVDPEEVAKLRKQYLSRVYMCVKHSLLLDYLCGMYLDRLKKLVGHGNFGTEVKMAADAWGCSAVTLQRRLQFYQDVRKGLDTMRLLPYSADALDLRLELEQLSEDDLAQAQAAVEAAAAEAKKQVAAHKASGRAPSVTVKLEGLSAAESVSFNKDIATIKKGMGNPALFAQWLMVSVADKAAEFPAPPPKGRKKLVFREDIFDE